MRPPSSSPDPAPDLATRARALVAELGLARPGDEPAVTPLAGGVASDIAVVALPGGAVCVKFALGRLRVAEDWRAPVHRSRAEFAWLRVAGEVVPGRVPGLLGWSDRLQGFAMDYVAGAPAWKARLLEGRVDQGFAALVGDALGRVHAASARAGFDRAPFRNADDFMALRIEPYLLATARRHPGLAGRLEGLARGLHAADAVLVHGDVSPKNILMRPDGPILLDAECASLGDPAFDAAFLLNHLLIKALHRPDAAAALAREALGFWDAYRARVDWEPEAPLGARVAALQPALMLARIDGKSPVEYLSDAGRARVRDLAGALVPDPPPAVPDLVAAIRSRGASR